MVGVRHGRGVVVIRDENGNWRAPSFISITGGSIGWQVGVQAIDVILVFKTKNSVKGLLAGKFTLGGDVAATAGPVGREASAATDARLNAEIYSYSRSRGLFVGPALDGSMISVDNEETAAYYRGSGLLPGDAPPGQAPQLPASAARLLAAIATYTTPEAAPAKVMERSQATVTMPSSGPAAAAMRQGAVHCPRMYKPLAGRDWIRGDGWPACWTRIGNSTWRCPRKLPTAAAHLRRNPYRRRLIVTTPLRPIQNTRRWLSEPNSRRRWGY